MKRTNKLFAVLASFCLTASTPAIFAGAAGLVVDYFGEPYYLESTTFENTLMLQTDGTVPVAEDFAALDGFVSVMPWSEWVMHQTVYPDYPEIVCKGAVPDENTYVVTFEGTRYYTDVSPEMMKIGREIHLQYDWAADMNLFICSYVNYVSMLNEDRDICITASTSLEMEEYPELAKYYNGDYTESNGTYRYYLDCIEGAADTYEAVASVVAICEGLSQQYESDADITGMSLCWAVNEGITNKFASVAIPVWEDAGDPNADGEVNSADAAELLVQAARNGAGASDKATADSVSEAPDPAADINADGVVDALDASYILQYAAAEGAGAPVTWMELLK